MPRITKKQKESGKAPKPRPEAPSKSFKSAGGGGGGSRPSFGGGGKARSSNHPPRAGGKGGFQVGPAHAPKNAYLGKAKKIKADLIDRAKMKKSYAKVLKAEGMESERVRDRTKAPAVAEAGAERETAGGVGAEKNGESSRSRPPKPTTDSPSSSLPTSPPAGSTNPSSSRKGKQRESHPSTSTPDHPPPAKRQRALSPIPISHPMPLTEFRQLKKDAFAKYHPPAQRSVSVGSANSGSGGMSGRSAGGTGGGGGFGFGLGGKGRGQPNMGARMGVLLEKIQRDRAV